MSMYSTESLVPDDLLAGANDNYATEACTILSGVGVLARGAVLGKITKGAVTVAAGTNTGGGTCTGLALLAGAMVGAYEVTCIATAGNGGTFSVIDPDGVRMADAVVGAAYAHSVAFTLNDVGTDFAVGDSFTITVAAGSGKMKLVNSANVDGSQVPWGILGEAVDSTSADVVTAGYIQGEFNERALVFGGTDVAATHHDALKAKGIILRDSVKR